MQYLWHGDALCVHQNQWRARKLLQEKLLRDVSQQPTERSRDRPHSLGGYMPEVIEEVNCTWCQKPLPDPEACIWENGRSYCDIICAESDEIDDS